MRPALFKKDFAQPISRYYSHFNRETTTKKAVYVADYTCQKPAARCKSTAMFTIINAGVTIFR